MITSHWKGAAPKPVGWSRDLSMKTQPFLQHSNLAIELRLFKGAEITRNRQEHTTTVTQCNHGVPITGRTQGMDLLYIHPTNTLKTKPAHNKTELIVFNCQAVVSPRVQPKRNNEYNEN